MCPVLGHLFSDDFKEAYPKLNEADEAPIPDDVLDSNNAESFDSSDSDNDDLPDT